MANYFEPFPLHYYNGTLCKNITQRTALSPQSIAETSLYYDYPVAQGERPDIASYKVYGDQYKDWLIYYANQIVDPYYQWYLDDKDLDQYIIDTYGSIAVAQETIRHYYINWKTDDRQITSSVFNLLLPNVKKYWSPFFNDSGDILYYTRSEMNRTFGTNRVVNLTMNVFSDTVGFVVGERVNQTQGGVVTAAGNICRVDSRSIQVQHVEGTFAAGALLGLKSNTTKNVGEVDTIAVSIVPSEESYWSPLNAYDYEVEQNELRKNIKVVIPSLAERMETTHRELIEAL